MKKINTIVLMNGDGTRFKKDLKYFPYKPFIKAGDKTLFEHTIDSFESCSLNLCCAVRLEHNFQFSVRDIIRKKMNIDTSFIYLVETSGNLESAYIAYNLYQECINKKAHNQPIMFLDCDNKFDGELFLSDIQNLKQQRNFWNKKNFACIQTFDKIDDSSKWAFAKRDENNKALDIKEKSRFAAKSLEYEPMVGAFYFASGKLFKKYAKKTLNQNNGSEPFMSQCVSKMISTKKDVFCFKTPYMIPLGTPEDVENFEKRKKIEH